MRHKIRGLSSCPRLAVFRSNQHVYAQIIDDEKGRTLASASDRKLKEDSKSNKAFEVGKAIAEQAIKAGIKKVVFDRGGFLYHGRIVKLAEGARAGGLNF